jgi:hypothetical protein
VAARESFDDSKKYEDENDDSFWESELMRFRQKLLLSVNNQNYDSVTSIDLGLIWTYAPVFVKTFFVLNITMVQSPAKGWSFPIFRASDLKFLGKIAKNHQKSEN